MRIDSLHLEGVGPFENTTIEFPKGTRDDLADVYLLVGQNGCGKTTALHVLAQLLNPAAAQVLHAERRFRSPNSLAIAVSDEFKWLARRRHDGLPASETGLLLDDELDRVGFFGPQTNVDPVVRDWRNWRRGVRLNLSFAAFGYAGSRTMDEVRVTTIHELTDSPIDGALHFHATANSQMLAQWVANQEYQRLRLENAGETIRAAAVAESVKRIERAIQEIISTEFRFFTGLDDLNVRVKMGDSIVDFDLLPEGLKSISSWLSDLLMRLERMQWRDSTPIHMRSFLLLLDEIDVHLHPAWQRKMLPAVQRLFPNAQIIASTHSPFVVASLADGAVIELTLDEKGRSRAERPVSAPLEMSYSQTMRRLFGIESDFDVETEKLFKELQATATKVLKGESGAREELDRRATELKSRGEEIAQLVQFELNQLNRLTPRPTGT